MDMFELKIPYNGEQVAVFKTISDMGNLVDSNSKVYNLVSDDEMNFFKMVSFGFLRLNLNGICQLVDKDFENLITIFNIKSTDKSGKGKFNSTIRISLKGEDDKNIYCDCEVTRKGFINRLDVDLEKIFSPMLHDVIDKALESYKDEPTVTNFIYEPLVSPSEVGLGNSAVESLDSQNLSSLVNSGNIREAQDVLVPLWLKILQFPANVVLYPIRFIRNFLFER